MEVAWAMPALYEIGLWNRYIKDEILTEFSRRVWENPDSFGIPIPDSEFLSTAVMRERFFVISERMPEKGFVVVRAVSREPIKNRKAAVYEIARHKIKR